MNSTALEKARESLISPANSELSSKHYGVLADLGSERCAGVGGILRPCSTVWSWRHRSTPRIPDRQRIWVSPTNIISVLHICMLHFFTNKINRESWHGLYTACRPFPIIKWRRRNLIKCSRASIFLVEVMETDPTVVPFNVVLVQAMISYRKV